MSSNDASKCLVTLVVSEVILQRGEEEGKNVKRTKTR